MERYHSFAAGGGEKGAKANEALSRGRREASWKESLNATVVKADKIGKQH